MEVVKIVFSFDSVEGYEMFEVVRFVNFVQTLIDSIEKEKENEQFLNG